MRRIVVLLALLVSILWVAVASAAVQQAPSINSIKWLPYNNSAFQQAKQSKHYILLFAKSKFCHWCQQMENTTWQTPALIQMVNADFIPVMIDVDDDVTVATAYRITSLPTLIVLDGDNHQIKQFTGYLAPNDLLNGLSSLTNNPKEAIASNKPAESTQTVASLISNQTKDQLLHHQEAIFQSEPTNTSDLDTIELALTSLQPEGRHFVKSALQIQEALLDPIWGGSFTKSDNGDIQYAKSTAIQAKDARIALLAYTFTHDQTDLAMADKIIGYANQFLQTADGVYHSGQDAFANTAAQNQSYYQKDDVARRQLGIPPVQQHIYSGDNGAMIAVLAEYYMLTGDTKSLATAEKAAEWVSAHLGIPNGGYRHEQAMNNMVYLSDTLFMANAYLALYQATTNPDYLNRAVDSARFIDTYFQGADNKPGFVSQLDLSNTTVRDSLFNATENADIVRLTSLLYSYTGDLTFQTMRMSALHYLLQPDVIATNPPALMLMAIYRLANYPTHILVIGAKQDAKAKSLYAIALHYAPLYARIDWWDPKEGPLVNSESYPPSEKAVVYVCHSLNCSLPIYDGDALTDLMNSFIAPVKSKPIAAATLQPKQTSSIDLHEIITNSMNAEKLLRGGSWVLIILGFVGFGMLLSFTPCILPLVPIMVSIIVGQTIGVKRQKTFLLSLTYVISMSLTYAVLGVFAGLFGIYLQVYMQATWIIVLFSLVFFILALSMFGMFELTLPRVIDRRINSWANLQKGGTYFGVITMGILGSLIVSPCVTAPLAGVLSFIANTGNYWLGGIGLFFMGFGMGIPLLIICLFSKDILPKAARWNEKIKEFFGLIMLGIAVWILDRVLSDQFTLILWAWYIILCTIFMGITKRKTKKIHHKLWKPVTILVFFYGVSLFINALMMNTDIYSIFLSQCGKQLPEKALPEISFQTVLNENDLERMIASAKERHMPILLDFSAKWCHSCTDMDKQVFHDPSIIPIMQKFVLLRVDLTQANSDTLGLARQFNVSGPPVVLFITGDGKSINLRSTGEVDVEQFDKTLTTALDQLHV